MGKLPEHWQRMLNIVNEEYEVVEECRSHNIDIDVVRRIAESTPMTLRSSFELCLRAKEANSNWQRLQTRLKA